MKIYNKTIGDGNPVFIVAEIGNNHNVNLETAKEMIKKASEAGADGVKFQTFKAGDIVSPLVKADEYSGWDVDDKYEYWVDFLSTLEMPYEWYKELIKLAHGLGLTFISTSSSIETAEFLNDVKADAIKIASMDVTNIPMLKEIAKMGAPVIVSLGMASIEEAEECVSIFDKNNLIILHCVSDYPLNIENANLNTIRFLRERFNVPVGFSDHSLSIDLDEYAVCSGASLIEKHFTLNRNNPVKAEHHFSLEPAQLTEMVNRIRSVERVLGENCKKLSSDEEKNRNKYRRSIFFKRSINKGEVIKKDDLICLRPETSVGPRHFDSLIGKKTKKKIKEYEKFDEKDIE